jgi:hypothetical protein
MMFILRMATAMFAETLEGFQESGPNLRANFISNTRPQKLKKKNKHTIWWIKRAAFRDFIKCDASECFWLNPFRFSHSSGLTITEAIFLHETWGPHQWILRLQSSGIWCHAVRYTEDIRILEEPATSSSGLLLQTWRQEVPSKHWYISTKLHGFTSQKT